MPTELPAGLQKALEIIGGQPWPEGDEAGLDRIAGAWRSLTDVIEDMTAALRKSADGVRQNMHGEFADAYGDYVDGTLLPTFDGLRETAQGLADQAQNTSADIQYARIMIVAQLVMLAATIALAWIPGIGQALVTAAASVARVVIGRVLSQVLANIIARAGSTVAGRVALNTVSGAVLNEVVELSLDATIQGLQLATGKRADWNEQFTKGAAISGAVGGAAAGAAGSLMHELTRIGGAALKNAAGNPGGGLGRDVVRGLDRFADGKAGRETNRALSAGAQGAAALAGDTAANAAGGMQGVGAYTFTAAALESLAGGRGRGRGGAGAYGPVAAAPDVGDAVRGLNSLTSESVGGPEPPRTESISPGEEAPESAAATGDPASGEVSGDVRRPDAGSTRETSESGAPLTRGHEHAASREEDSSGDSPQRDSLSGQQESAELGAAETRGRADEAVPHDGHRQQTAGTREAPELRATTDENARTDTSESVARDRVSPGSTPSSPVPHELAGAGSLPHESTGSEAVPHGSETPDSAAREHASRDSLPGDGDFRGPVSVEDGTTDRNSDGDSPEALTQADSASQDTATNDGETDSARRTRATGDETGIAPPTPGQRSSTPPLTRTDTASTAAPPVTHTGSSAATPASTASTGREPAPVTASGREVSAARPATTGEPAGDSKHPSTTSAPPSDTGRRRPAEAEPTAYPERAHLRDRSAGETGLAPPAPPDRARLRDAAVSDPVPLRDLPRDLGDPARQPEAAPQPADRSGDVVLHIDDAPPLEDPLAERTHQVHALLRHNAVIADTINGTAVRADARAALQQANVPAQNIDRLLDGLSDIALKDDFKALVHEGLRLRTGQGADAVEIHVRLRPGDDTSPGTEHEVTSGKQDFAHGTDAVAGGAYGKSAGDKQSGPRRDGGFSHFLALPTGTSHAHRTVDPSFGFRGATPQTSWQHGDSTELEHSASYTPPNNWSGSTHDLNHDLVVRRADVRTTRSGAQPGGAVLSMPETLIKVDSAEAKASGGPRATFVRGDQGLFDVLTGLVGGHPKWRAADAVNSPVRNDLLELSGSKSLSHLGNDVLDGSTLTKSLETHGGSGHRRTAQVEIRFRQGKSRAFAAPQREPADAESGSQRPRTSSTEPGDADSADEPGKTMLTEQGRGYKNEVSHTTGSAQPFNVDAGLGLGFTWSLFDKPGTSPAQPSYVHGDRLDLRLDGRAFRSSGEDRSLVRTAENTAATTWFGSGRLHGLASDLTYDVKVRFDDGQVREGEHHVPEGATTWSLADSDGPAKPEDDPGHPAEDNTAPFSPHKVIGAAETHFPGADGLRDAIRDRLPANVLRDDAGTGGNVRVSDNEVVLAYFVSARGLTSHSPGLNGDGMSFLLNRRTHATGTPDDFLQVVIRAVPRADDPVPRTRSDAPDRSGTEARSGSERRYTPETDRSRDGSGWADTTLRGELQEKSRIDHSETVRAATTVGGSSGVRAGIGSGRTARTVEFTGGYNRSFGSEQHSLESSSGQGRGHGWAGKEFSSHHRAVDYEVTVRGNGHNDRFVVSGGAATTYRSGRTALTEPAATEASRYRPVDRDAPLRPDGWSPGTLPDHFAVHGLDLPAGRAVHLTGELLGDHPAGSQVAEHQVHVFTGEDKVAVNLDRATTGTYNTPVHRYAEGEWLGFRNRLGDASMHVALSNPRVSGPPTKMTLTFIGKSTGSTGHGSEHGRTDYTFGNGRVSIAPIKQFYLLPQPGYGRSRNATEGESIKQEHEHTTTTTYDGPAYLVTYDTTTVLSGRDVDHTGVGPYDGRAVGDWKHAEAHRRDSVQVWVPAREIGQVGLPPGWDDGHTPCDARPDADETLAGQDDRPTTESAADDRPVPALVTDGHASPSVRPEVTERLIAAIKASLLRVDPAEVPTGVLSRFTHYLTSGIAEAGRLVHGSSPQVAAEDLAQQVIGEVSPHGLAAALPDLVGVGKQWSTSVDGPLGSTRVSLTLHARLGEGRFDGTDEGWSDNQQSKATTTSSRVVSESRSHNGNFSLRSPIYTDAQIARSVGAGTMTTGSLADTRKRTEQSVTERTTSQFTSGDVAWFSHPIELELEVRKTAHANHAARSLTGGLVDRIMPGVETRTPRINAIPDAVRSYHPAGESAPAERAAQPVTGWPESHYSRVGGRSVAGLVRDVLDGAPAGEPTGHAPPPVPPEATSARQAVNTGANPAALSAHLPEALSDTGHRVDGLDHDGRHRTTFGQRHPLRSLTFHAQLEQAHVTPAGYTPLEGLEINKTEVAKSSVDDERTAGPMWNTMMASVPLTLFPRPTAGSTFEPGTALTEMGEVRGSGPALSWQRTDTANLTGKKTEDIRLSAGEIYLVEAQALWTVIPGYRGEVPSEWTTGRTTRDTVYVRTDANGLRAMGLEPPPDNSTVDTDRPGETSHAPSVNDDSSDADSAMFFDAVSEFGADVFYDARSDPESPADLPEDAPAPMDREPASDLEQFLTPGR